MIHPDTKLQFINKEIGYGVVATKFIPKGTITWAFDLFDQTFPSRKVGEMPMMYKDILDKYSYRDNKGNFILCWDNARYLNHSFNSNCVTTAYNFELAVKDIYPGEELTDDYGYLNCVTPFECIPEPNTIRKKVMPDDLLCFYKEWDYKLLLAFELFAKVEQPLWFLVEEKYKDKVKGISNRTEEMDSILNSFYNDDPALMAKKKCLLQSYGPIKIYESFLV